MVVVVVAVVVDVEVVVVVVAVVVDVEVVVLVVVITELIKKVTNGFSQVNQVRGAFKKNWQKLVLD